MSYHTVNISAADPALIGRIRSSYVEQQLARGDPQITTGLPDSLVWTVVSADDIEAAYASALAANNPNPGGDESVITDGMILANVQPNLPPPATVPGT